MPDLKSTGHLNIKLRWALPDELRRLSLLSLGFNLWRMPESFAVANGYDARPPTTAALLQLAGGPSPEVKRVNTGTLLATKVFSAADVADFVADPDTALAVDDNGRALGTPFADGQQLRYFVTARDLLGRDGLVSPGRLAVACHRLPPPVPAGLRVRCEHRFDVADPDRERPDGAGMGRQRPGRSGVPHQPLRGHTRAGEWRPADRWRRQRRRRPRALRRRAADPAGECAARRRPARIHRSRTLRQRRRQHLLVHRARGVRRCLRPIYSDPGPPVFACVRKAGAPAPPEFCSTDTNVPLAAIAFDDAATEPAPAGAPDFGFRIRVSCKRLATSGGVGGVPACNAARTQLTEPIREVLPGRVRGASDRVDTEFVVNASSPSRQRDPRMFVRTTAGAVSPAATHRGRSWPRLPGGW